jgi:hypothetical protein
MKGQHAKKKMHKRNEYQTRFKLHVLVLHGLERQRGRRGLRRRKKTKK